MLQSIRRVAVVAATLLGLAAALLVTGAAPSLADHPGFTVTITGDLKPGSTLTATLGTPDVPADSYDYQWFRDGYGSPIAGATGSTLGLTDADVTHQFGVSVTGHWGAEVQTVYAAQVFIPLQTYASGPDFQVDGTFDAGSPLTVSITPSVPAADHYRVVWSSGGTTFSDLDAAPAADGTASSSWTPTNDQAGVTPTITVYAVKPGYAQSSASSAPGKIWGVYSPAPSASISGTPAVGYELTATAGSPAPTPGYVDYTWFADGTQFAHTGDNPHLTLQAAQLGKQITVTALVGGTNFRQASSTSAPLGPVTATAHPGFVATISGDSTVGSLLTASVGTPNPGADSYDYVWTRSHVVIAGATGGTYRLTADDFNHEVQVEITGHWGAETQESTGSAGLIEAGVWTSPPSMTFSGAALVGQPLTAVVGGSAPRAETYHVSWVRLSDSTLVLEEDLPVDAGGTVRSTYVPVAADRGSALRVTAIAHRTAYGAVGNSVTADTSLVRDAFATAPSPVIIGTPTVGTALSVDEGVTDPTADSFTYQWLADGAPAAGGSARSYTPVVGDVGKQLTVVVKAHKVGYEDASSTSAPVGPVTAAGGGGGGGDTHAVSVSVTGTPRVGVQLAATLQVTGAAPDTISYQWHRDGTPVDGATTSRFTPAPGDVGHVLSVSVVATWGAEQRTASSPDTDPVALGTLTPLTQPTVSGAPVVGEVLTAGLGSATPMPSTQTLVWRADGSPIAGETGPTYTVRPADLGHAISVQVTSGREGYEPLLTTSGAVGPVTGEGDTPAPTLTLMADRTSIRLGQKVVLTWAATDAESLLASGAWSGELADSGSVAVEPDTIGESEFVLTATGADGSTVVRTVTVAVTLPAATFDVDAPRRVRRGGTLAVTARGLEPGESYVVLLGDRTLADGTADRRGRIRIDVAVPRRTPSGRSTLEVQGSLPDRSGTSRVVVADPRHGKHRPTTVGERRRG